MSKAFVNDDVPGEEVIVQRRDLTKGSENHMTSEGFKSLKEELSILEAEGLPDSTERRLYLRQLIDSANVIVPENQSGNRVLFGATVEVRDEDDQHRVYRLVGVDETDVKAGKVSWISPIGQALLGARVGEAVEFKTPTKDEELEILSIQFKPIP